jgi:MOSC domain-containing protein YiiM
MAQKGEGNILLLPDQGFLRCRAQPQAGRVVSINRSNGGVPKEPVDEAPVTEVGLAGDRHEDTRCHGGPDRAVVVYSLEVIQSLQQEGHPIRIGSAGENLTLAGLDWDSIVPGIHLDIGAVKLLLTKYCTPCYKISGSFLNGGVARISQKEHPGWSRVCARVIAGGTVRVGDRVDARH